ncbi:bifunctional sugar phosphate isomerase/epimerase/4-hydroxyphenylpyruvate dioxygenase family protein [Arsenicicoccus dermatophilus]|uniref:bifunctional sugar phosphate isomerase/epimerase/4-hydroxyphenylpyruvate dioxygenase family protein n=1 Tax=Arsenicicoccus dermatophilus TaxID=1076331 RepID=UPI003916EA65
MMRTGIATVCLSGTLADKLEACAAAGFDGVEIFEQDLVVSPLAPAEVRRRCADLGLAIDLYQPFRDVEGTDEEVFARTLRRARHKLELMAQLGTDTMLVCSNVATATVDDDDLRVEQLCRLADLAHEHGMRLAYEALAWGRHVSTYDHAWELVRRADHPALGTCLDSFHVLSRGSDPAGIEQIPGDKIFFLQLADAPALCLDVLSWSRHHRVFPGQGDWDLPGFTAQVLRTGYAGPLSLEIFNDVFRQADESRTAVDARRSLTWLEDRTAALLDERPGRWAGAATRAPEPGGCPAVELGRLPRVEEPHGFNFVEIPDAAGGPVEQLLTALGFTARGRHRTKDVALWTLGRAAVVVNHEDRRGRPPHVAGLGLDVEQPVIAASRALRLGSHLLPRRTEAGEEVLRGVEAPDGTELYFCGSATPTGSGWWREFGDGEVHRDTVGATVVDHVNLAQPAEALDESVLFLSSSLALDPLPSVDVASPTGLVRSQVMRSADGVVRIVLNLAPPLGNHDEVTATEHVALAVDDLVTVAREARTRGLVTLPVPANYYADLAARFDLDPELLATLQDLDLLYDEDGQGQFLHLYTETVGGVFFELVERRGGYDGYGAPNAPVRHAIQHARALRRTSDPGA